MKDFLDNENLTQDENDVQEKSAQNDEVKIEQNDNWEFEAEAHTLNTSVLENDELEIVIPKAESKTEPKVEAKVEEPMAKPTKKPTPKKDDPKKFASKPSKGDKLTFTLTGIVVAILIAACVATGIFYYNVPSKSINESKLKPADIAMTVGDVDISLGMYSYYYSVVTNNYISQAGYSNNINMEVPFDEQTTTDEDGNTVTWQELFDNETLDKAKYILAYYSEGVKHGVTVTDEQQATIKENIESLEDYAKEQGQTLDGFIDQNYGKYCNLEVLEAMLEQCYIAENYYQELAVESRATQEEEKAYFEKDSKDNYNNYLSVDAALLQISYTPGDSQGQEDAIAEAKKYASKIKSVDDMKKLIPVIYKNDIAQYVEMGYAANADECAEMIASSMKQSYCISLLSEGQRLDSTIEDWLFNSEVKAGTAKYFNFPSDGVVYIMLKDSEATLNEETVYSVRHILITPESDKEDEEEAQAGTQDFTKAQWVNAYKKAQSIVEEYEKAGKTEYNFALLAEKYSADSASITAGGQGAFGGQIFGVSKGEMVKEFEGWALDKSRKYGDVEIVKSNFGYHIMYFVETDKAYLQYCEGIVNTNKEDEFLDSVRVKLHKNRIAKVQESLAIINESANTDTTDAQEPSTEPSTEAQETDASTEETEE